VARLFCPYCFAEISRKDVLFRCVGGGAGRLAGCPPKLDPIYAKYLGTEVGAVLPPTFKADGRKSRAVHEACQQASMSRVCPHCHNRLPDDYCDVDSRLVALIGAKSSGKSTYIGVLVHELLNRLGEELSASFAACDDLTRRRYHDSFLRPLYEQHKLLPVTQSAAAELHAPLVYRLTLGRRGLRGRGRPASMTLVLFDTAGEDLTTAESVDQHLRYLGAADAIVFLVDPAELPGAAADLRLPHSPQLNSQQPSHDPFAIIGRVTTLLRAHHGRPAPRRLRVDIALAFTKIDLLDSEVATQSALHRERRRIGRLDLTDRESVEEQIRGLLEKWGALGLDRLLADNFETFGLFGLSALGAPPDDGVVNPSGIRPHRIEDPLIWLLHRFGMIPASKG
jgi:hypothetical protein